MAYLLEMQGDQRAFPAVLAVIAAAYELVENGDFVANEKLLRAYPLFY